ncbi:MAG TPA: ComEA family DNA-binding protein [Planctomycetota bacterium]|nr:ComEA family DNA-binding protein [Planctomycetota bacterium]
MGEPLPGKAPWRLLDRDRLVLYCLCILMFAIAAGRYAWSHWAPARDVRTLAEHERIRYRVDLNKANEDELDLLPGIGPAKAKLIAKYREANGPFKTGADLAAVPGISRACVAGLRGLVTPDVEGPREEAPK